MILEFIEAEQAQEAGLLSPSGTGIADPAQANKSSTVPNVTHNLSMITEGLVLAGVTTEDANRHTDHLHFWKAFDATVTNVKDTKRTEEALAGEVRLREASTMETSTSQTVATIFEGITASQNREISGNKKVTTDDTNVGKLDDRSLFDEDEESVQWVDEDIVLDVGVPLVLVDDDDNTGDTDDDDGSANIGNSDEDNAEVYPKLSLGTTIE
jgi:hypothetical protein